MRYVKWPLIGIAALLAVAGLVLLFVVGCGCGGDTRITAARFAELRANHTALRAFLSRMPKGADLHVHLSGAVFAEDLIGWAVAKGLCYKPSDFSIAAPPENKPCDPEHTPPIADVINPANPAAQGLYDGIVNSLSMRNYVPSAKVPSGHDQFFATFDKFGAVTWQITAEMTAERLAHYAADAVQHTELMISLLSSDYRRQYVYAITGVTDPTQRLQILRHHNLDGVAKGVSKQLDAWQADVKKILLCDTPTPKPGCDVTYRYIAQVNRNSDEASVFVQTAFAAALVRLDPRVAGLNFVGPEDYRIAREDYHRHMEMIGFLTRRTGPYAEVPVALHAGELWLGLVPPNDLTFHIREAVEVAGAKRIGHGVALAFERRSAQLLGVMRNKPVVVEINLTSNDVILGVRGKDHPLTAYRTARVPVVLSTDDAGVSRIDLTNEYFRAARDYPLGYRDLKLIAHNSIQYSFLGTEAKKEAIRRLDAATQNFEHAVAAEHSGPSNARAWIASWF